MDEHMPAQMSSGNLPPPTLELSDSAGDAFDKKGTNQTRDVKWEEMFDRLQQYIAKFGNTCVPYRCSFDPPLGRWVNQQRLANELRTINPEHKERLVRKEFVWRVKQKFHWDNMFERLEEFKTKHGHCLVPQRHKEDPQLGRWVDTQRENKHRRLTPEHRARLESLGFVWSALKESWDEMFNRLVKYRNRYGDTKVTQRFSEDPQLGKWVKNQRLRRGSLPPDRIKGLDTIGFIWKINKDQDKETRDSSYKRLLLYKAKYGDCLVPRVYPADLVLSVWMQKQRELKDCLTRMQCKKLERIGFEWTPPRDSSDKEWDQIYDRLVVFKAKHGTCVIPPSFSEWSSVSNWTRKQQLYFTMGALTKEKLDRLSAIGFPFQGISPKSQLAAQAQNTCLVPTFQEETTSSLRTGENEWLTNDAAMHSHANANEAAFRSCLGNFESRRCALVDMASQRNSAALLPVSNNDLGMPLTIQPSIFRSNDRSHMIQCGVTRQEDYSVALLMEKRVQERLQERLHQTNIIQQMIGVPVETYLPGSPNPQAQFQYARSFHQRFNRNFY